MKALLLFFFLSSTSHAANNESMTLALGQSLNWNAPTNASISVSNGAIVRVRDLGRSLKITGKKLGYASIRAGSRTLEVQVVSESLARLQNRFAALLAKRRGLETSVDGKNLVVRGRLLRLEDWQELGAIAGDAHIKWRFEAKISDEVTARAQKYFLNLLRISKLPDLSFELQPSAAISLSTESADLKAKVAELFEPYGFRIESSSSTMSLEPLVRVQITVAEVRRDFQRKLGVDWPEAVGARLLPLPTQLLGEGVVLNLQMLEQNGLGHILASPTLLCRSGKEAEFFAGGEFPIKIANFRTNDVIWKKHGIILKIKPKADFSGRMSIALTTEVSVVDDATKVDGIPGLLTNRIESHFDLTKPQTIILSGLIKKEWGDTIKGLPGLSTMPVLGRLFSSRDYRENQTELVVFVTPEIAKESAE